MTLGFELAGDNATWTLEEGRVVIEYSRNWGNPKLLRRIGRRVIPDEAIAGAQAGHTGGVPVLQLLLRPGADPYLAAAAGQLPEDHALYDLELARGQEDLAGYHADGLRLRAGQNPAEPCEKFLLDAETPPLRLKCYDGDAHLEPGVLRFRWNDEAAGSKRAQGESVYPLGELTGAEWVKPSLMSGHLAVLTGERAGDVEEDPRVILFGMGYGSIADSLPFAATLLAEIQRCSGEHTALGALPPAQAGPGLPDEIVAAIRALTELREAGLLSDEEFERRKQEQLDRL
ncbi:DUF4429 domain-containing protein [Amycolatopsis jejuensis]|uniref:DUF4429 domain-containing protein n=1 Tax=Amycolatopsis jejuensis TaxID=330084 RepID=UPI000526E0B8|nr:DUF4429 domain-containing protein [Amycolatopsis jejuensis]